jgi:hypothetical protein
VLADSFEKRFTPINLEMPRVPQLACFVWFLPVVCLVQTLMPIANIPMLDYALELLATSSIQEVRD